MKSRGSLRQGQMGLSSRSLGQILEKSCVHSRGHSFDPIFLKLDYVGQGSRSLGQIVETTKYTLRPKFLSHPSLLP